ncbi:MAG: hypothetical protein Q9227_004182 [Pyrenula ochraceoflavens]
MHSQPQRRLDLAFGVEIENVFIHKEDLDPPCHPPCRAEDIVALALPSSRIIASIVSLTDHTMVDLTGSSPMNQDYHGLYRHWTLTTDGSVRPDGKTLLERLSDRVNPSNFFRWDSYPNEVVSRILPAPTPLAEMDHPSFKEIKTITSALQGKQSSVYGAYAAPSCGLHVHVGVDPAAVSTSTSSTTFPLPILQHIAYLQIQYESFLSLLHPRCRRGFPNENSEQHCRSNLQEFLGNGHTCPKRRRLQPLKGIRARIFTPSMTTERLALMMSAEKTPSEPKDGVPKLSGWEGNGKPEERYRIVNWTSFAQNSSGTKPRTLEFRQHEGTVDGDEICQWVSFCIAFVRLAERLSRGEASYTFHTWEDIDLSTPEKIRRIGKTLFDNLELSAETAEFWTARLSDHIDEEIFSSQLTDKDTCRECSKKSNSRACSRTERTAYKNAGMQGKKNAKTKKAKKTQEIRAIARGRKRLLDDNKGAGNFDTI